MYIEYSPLEGQLHTILKNPTTAATLLALVGTEETAVQERAGAVGNYTDRRDAAPNTARSRVTNTLSGLSNIDVKQRELRNEAQQLGKVIKNARNISYEEEDDSQYELIDVVDREDQESITHRDQKLQHNFSGDRLIDFNRIKDRSPEKSQYSQNIEIEIEDEDFVYVVTKITREERTKRNQAKGEHSIRQKTIGIPSKALRKRKREVPLPSVLPISVFKDSYVERQAAARSGLKLLNGNLHKFYPSSQSDESNCSIRSNYIYVPRRRLKNSIIKSSQYCRNSDSDEEQTYGDDFEYIESNNNRNSAHFVQNNDYSVVNNLNEEASNSQMGIDIVNKIRKLLSFNSSTKKEDVTEGNRKRRCEEWSPEAVDAHEIKYRRVENNFPKFIAGPLDDDVDSFPYPKKPRKPLLLQQHHHFDKSPTRVMSQQKSTLSTDKSMQRRSLFAPPQTIHRLVKNTTYADLEFSDDDEPELVNGFNIAVDKKSNVCPIPRTSHLEDGRSKTQSGRKLPPPPLIDTRTGSILASSLLPDIKNYPGYGPTYIDALKKNLIGRDCRFQEHIPTPSSTINTSKTDADFPRHVENGIGDTIRSIPWCSSSRSILTQERETEERDKYFELLKQLVPGTYGAETAAPSITKSTDARRHSDILMNNISAPRKQETSSFVDTFMHSTLRQEDSSPRDTGLREGVSVSRHENLKQRQNGPLSLRHDFSIPRYEGFIPHLEATVRRHENLIQPSDMPFSHPPLSSTINLVDDDGEVKLVSTKNDLEKPYKLVRPKRRETTVIVDDDDINDLIEVIDLENVYRRQENDFTKKREHYEREKENAPVDLDKDLPYVEPVNSLKIQFSSSPHLKENWLENFEKRWGSKKKERKEETERIEKEAEKHTELRRAAEAQLQERFKNFQFFSPDLVFVDEFPEPAAKKEPEYITFTSQQEQIIKSAITGPPDQVLISKFNLNITRRDIHTLIGHNWLNDEVINFYMNLLTERGEKRGGKSGNFPTVYAMNTFFIPRLVQVGHSGIKRWTRKVDIFSKDIIPVPVHVGGVHWCMAIIHLKERTIKYYDSMGTPNPSILKALEQYLKDESMDKRKKTFDTSQFVIESVVDVPRQMNGSDCGVFSCMFAEFVTRNKPITFSQQQMEYFRQKMILEIVQGELLQ